MAHKRVRATHENIPMKMLCKAMELFHSFLIEFSWAAFHQLFMDCFGGKLTCSWPMNAFHGYFMATGHP